MLAHWDASTRVINNTYEFVKKQLQRVALHKTTNLHFCTLVCVRLQQSEYCLIHPRKNIKKQHCAKFWMIAKNCIYIKKK